MVAKKIVDAAAKVVRKPKSKQVIKKWGASDDVETRHRNVFAKEYQRAYRVSRDGASIRGDVGSEKLCGLSIHEFGPKSSPDLVHR